MTATDLVGRAGVLDAVRAAMADPERRAVTLAGAAGVGKSRIADECARLARDAGRATIRVAGTLAGSTIPFGAVATLLPPLTGAPDDRAGMLRSAVASIQAAAGAGGPTVLVVDDAHLLDEASATLVQQVVDAAAAFVVATVRAGERCPDPVVALWKDGRGARVEVDGLTEDEHRAFVDVVVGGQVDSATRGRLFHASGGNPLLTRELVHAAREAGVLRDEGGVFRITAPATSARLDELVGSRIGALDADEQKALELVALGEPLGLGILDALGLAAAVERLERRDLALVTLDGHRFDVRVAHPLFGEVARARIPALRARNRRRALAEALEATGARRSTDALRIATWRLDAGLQAPPERWLEAARAARARYDLDLALRLARAALDGGAGAPAAAVAGEVLYQLGRCAEADVVLAAGAAAAADEATLATLTMTRADNLFYGLARCADAVALVADVRGRCREQLWLDVLGVMEAGMAVILTGDCAAALERLEPLTDHPLELVALASQAILESVLVQTGRIDDAVAMARAARPRHAAIGDGVLPMSAETHRYMEVLALTELGRLDEAEAVGLAGHRAVVSRGEDRVQAWMATMLGRLHVRQGRAADARVLAREAVPLFRLGGQAHLARLAATVAVEAAVLLGDAHALDAATAQLDEVDDTEARVFAAEVDRVRAAAARFRGDDGAARRLLRKGADHGASTGEIVTELLCLHDLVRLGEAAAVAARVAAVAARIDGELARAIADHAAALAAGDAGAAERAAGAFEAIGALPWAADALVAAAGLAPDERDAVALRRRARALLGRTDVGPAASAPADAAGGADGLSEREREIAVLAAAGRSDKEIAAELYLSVRTVGNHLLRAYRKLGVRSRDELRDALDVRGSGS